jgi:predicted GNAT family acetyltransferase
LPENGGHLPRFESSSTMATDFDVRHNAEGSRFEALIDGRLARCSYRMHDGVMLLVHTEVPAALEGRGIGAALVRAALDHASAARLQVRPRCSFVSAYIARHPEYRHLLG